MAVLIPARRYEPALGPLIDTLLDAGFGEVLVVDDGSPREDREAFDALEKKHRVRVLRHPANLGKGRALKTGFGEFLTRFGGFAGLVTADADGQHSAGDIVRVANSFLAAPDCVVLGCRSLGNGTPLRSRFGNALTCVVFRLLSGRKLADTQTGLRAFPAALLPELIALSGERYEYEMTVLAYLCREGHALREVPIATIYTDSNRSSAFHPIRDSIRIYSVLLRFYVSKMSFFSPQKDT